MGRIFIAGATGVLGHRLVERLTDRGHVVYGLVRDDAGAELVTARGGIPRMGDVLEASTLEDAIPDVDTIVHAATALPTATKPSSEDWAHNDRVRLEGAQNLIEVAGERVDHVLFPSIVWVAKQPDGSQFDETATRHPDRTTESAAAVEDYLREASAEYGFKTAILRCGFFYAPDAAHTRQFGRALLSRRLPIVGGGLLGRRDATLSFLHADDAARAFATAVDAELSGLYHVVDDQPVTFAAFITTLAEHLDAPQPRRVPGWVARLIIGKETTAVLAQSMPTTNDRFQEAVGWKPMYPTYREGIQHVVKTWENNGTLVETDEGYQWHKQ